MNNEKLKPWVKIVIISLCLYALFAGVVLFFYHKIRYDPEDGAATDFLYASEALQEEIGEIRYIAKRSVDKEIEDESGLHVTYSVETYRAKYHIQVHFEDENGEWIPQKYTILELVEEYSDEKQTN